MLKKFAILLVILITLGAAFYYFVFLKQGPPPVGTGAVPQIIPGPAGLDAGQSLPQANPFEGTKTNPFEGAYQNPFE